jgi:hypothetical protein
METITRNVRNLTSIDRCAAERIVGRGLSENQQLVIQVLSVDVGPTYDTIGNGDELPAWCNIYEGLTDEQIVDIEKSIVRTRTTRTIE